MELLEYFPAKITDFNARLLVNDLFFFFLWMTACQNQDHPPWVQAVLECMKVRGDYTVDIQSINTTFLGTYM